MLNASRLRITADAVIVGLSVMLVVWSTVLYRVLESVQGSGLLRGTVSVAYPTGDMLMMSTLVVALMGARHSWRAPVALYLLALTALLFGDAGFAYLDAGAAYQTGSWVDSGWTVAMVLLVLAVRQVPLATDETAQQVEGDERWVTVLLAVCSGATIVALVLHEARRVPLAEHPLLVVLLIGVMAAMTARAIVARREGEAYVSALARTTTLLEEIRLEHDLAFAASGMTTWTWEGGDDRWHLGSDGDHHSATLAGLEGTFEEVLTTIVEDDRSRVRSVLTSSIPADSDYDVDFGIAANGTKTHVRTRGRARRRPDGSIDRLSGVVFDVTEGQTALNALRRRDENLTSLNAFNVRVTRAGSSDAVPFDAVETLGTMLGADCELWQIEASSSIPALRAAWAPPRRTNGPHGARGDDEPDTEVRFEIASMGEPWGFLSLRSTSNRPLTTEAEALTREVAGIVGASIERSTASMALWREARYDSLTGLPNRVRLAEELGLALAAGGAATATLLYLDLDDFKAINDAYGHATGDHVLVVVAQRLSESVRPTDTVARLGGDEFAVVLPGLDSGGPLDTVLERLQATLRQPLDLGRTVVHPRASIGVATTGNGTPTADDLLRNADLAMYISKAEGAGQPVAFEDRFHREAIERGQLADELRHALDRSEFVLHYQPVIDLQSGQVCGAEALLRWARPGVGVVAPAVFLDGVVALGLMGAVTTFVIDDACAWTASYARLHPDRQFVMEVNVAPSDITTPGLTSVISAALARTGLDPSRLCLEVTESAVIRESTAVMATLTALRELGVGMAIDDFGTGYSSMRQLKALPVDIVKIDQGFVDGLGTELDDSTIVAAIVDMAHTLSLSVIAEGVETERQRDALMGLGCEMAQGYLFGRPVPGAVALEGVLAASLPLPVIGDESAPPKTVVIADDLEDDRRLITRQLSRSGRYRVVGEAANGLEAVRMAHHLDPDLVLLDLNMPVLDGLAALARIRAESPRSAVVLLSGHASTADIRAAVVAGARGCIIKGPSNVVAALDEALHGPDALNASSRRHTRPLEDAGRAGHHDERTSP